MNSARTVGEVPQDRPIHHQEVFATLYQQLGIDVRTATIPDNSGRPQYRLDHQSVVKELV
ncbi:MAG TPA: hypothetical protein PK992_17385 [Planctomycetaceae bacterium]|nr:hypothetical protein [Planctomycetaceae bacterium]